MSAAAAAVDALRTKTVLSKKRRLHDEETGADKEEKLPSHEQELKETFDDARRVIGCLHRNLILEHGESEESIGWILREWGLCNLCDRRIYACRCDDPNESRAQHIAKRLNSKVEDDEYKHHHIVSMLLRILPSLPYSILDDCPRVVFQCLAQTNCPNLPNSKSPALRDLIQCLIQAGMAFDSRLENGQTALGYACAQRSKIALLFLKLGSGNVNEEDCFGDRALSLACGHHSNVQNSYDQEKLVGELIKRSSDETLNYWPFNGQAPIYIALDTFIDACGRNDHDDCEVASEVIHRLVQAARDDGSGVDLSPVRSTMSFYHYAVERTQNIPNASSQSKIFMQRIYNTIFTAMHRRRTYTVRLRGILLDSITALLFKSATAIVGEYITRDFSIDLPKLLNLHRQLSYDLD